MTYTCIRAFCAQGRNFTIGQTINRTQYIALTAEERGNFKEDFKPLKAKRVRSS